MSAIPGSQMRRVIRPRYLKPALQRLPANPRRHCRCHADRQHARQPSPQRRLCNRRRPSRAALAMPRLPQKPVRRYRYRCHYRDVQRREIHRLPRAVRRPVRQQQRRQCSRIYRAEHAERALIRPQPLQRRAPSRPRPNARPDANIRQRYRKPNPQQQPNRAGNIIPIHPAHQPNARVR